MLKNRLTRVLSALICALFLSACALAGGGTADGEGGIMPAPREAPAPRVLRVAFPESPGINETYADGTHGGSVYDWLHEIAKYTGWQYEFVTGGVNEMLDGMARGEYDLMGGMFYLDSLKDLFN